MEHPRSRTLGLFGIAAWLAVAGFGCQPGADAGATDETASEPSQGEALADAVMDAGSQPPAPEPLADAQHEPEPRAETPAPEIAPVAAPVFEPFREPPALQAATGFAVFGAAGVRNLGATTLIGELGTVELDGAEGVPEEIAVQAGTELARSAEDDVVNAYAALADEPCSVQWQGSELNGIVFRPGVHCFPGSVTLNGAIVFDGQGRDDAVFILKVQGDLTTASDSHVGVRNCGHEGRVFWQLDGKAELGEASEFAGNLLAMADVTLKTAARSFCRILTQGTVHMDTNHVSISRCGETALADEADAADADAGL